MRRQKRLGVLIIGACAGLITAFSLGGAQGNLYAQDIDAIKAAEASASKSEVNKNYDKDFLTKDKIKPSPTGFRDDLFLPAKISPLAAHSLLTGIVSAGSRLVAVGIRGHIIYSDDKGKSWKQAKVPVSLDLTSVCFPTPQQGWAVGQDGVVLHSVDGGLSWIKQLDGYGALRIMNKYYQEHPASGKLGDDIKFIIDQGPVNPFLSVWFENESAGFVVGAFNLIFCTEDGGKSWVPWFDRTENPGGFHLYSISSVGKDVFISGEQGLILKLDSRAQRFRKIKTPYAGTYFGLVGKPGVLVALGMRGNIYRSGNNGSTWEKVDTVARTALLGGTVKNDGSIILVSQGSDVLVSKDDGKSFTGAKRDSRTMGIPAHAVTLADNDTLVIASWFGIQLEKIQ